MRLRYRMVYCVFAFALLCFCFPAQAAPAGEASASFVMEDGTVVYGPGEYLVGTDVPTGFYLHNSITHIPNREVEMIISYPDGSRLELTGILEDLKRIFLLTEGARVRVLDKAQLHLMPNLSQALNYTAFVGSGTIHIPGDVPAAAYRLWLAPDAQSGYYAVYRQSQDARTDPLLLREELLPGAVVEVVFEEGEYIQLYNCCFEPVSYG